MSGVREKRCRRCREVKPLEEFGLFPDGKNRHRICDLCLSTKPDRFRFDSSPDSAEIEAEKERRILVYAEAAAHLRPLQPLMDRFKRAAHRLFLKQGGE